MAVKITKTDEKPLMARKEITAEISFPEKATPSNADVRKELAAQLKVDEKAVVVKHIYTGFGSSDASVEAYVYDSEGALKRFEPVTKAMKLKGEEAAKKAAEAKAAEAEKPAEAPKAEAKPEEKKEEAPKKEEKKEEKPAEKKEEPKKEEKPAEEKKE